MPALTLDGRSVTVPSGATVLDAARSIGIDVPTMCHVPGLSSGASCMVCLVFAEPPGRLVPACVTVAEEAMSVRTDGDDVRTSRRLALELLLSDHVGECEAPCRLACPAHLDIPAMLGHLAHGREGPAREALWELPLAAVLGRICPAPCEKACRRGRHDGAVHVCRVQREIADLALGDAALPPCKPSSGHRVAVVGSGPAGLATAYFLAREGHGCTLFEAMEHPGGTLRHELAPGRLPTEVLDAEVQRLVRMGVVLQTRTRFDRDVSLDELLHDHEAVVLATGAAASEAGPPWSPGRVDRVTHVTSRPGVFAGGGLVHPGKVAVRSVAEGRAMAEAASRHVAGETLQPPVRPFNVHLGKLEAAELAILVAGCEPRDAGDAVEREARRCLQCACLRSTDCRLRDYATAYGARHGSFGPERRPFERHDSHPRIVYEPGKCIACGLCVRVAERAGETVGLAFVGRGFDLRIGVPYGEDLSHALVHSAEDCAGVCPTGALALRRG